MATAGAAPLSLASIRHFAVARLILTGVSGKRLRRRRRTVARADPVGQIFLSQAFACKFASCSLVMRSFSGFSRTSPASNARKTPNAYSGNGAPCGRCLKKNPERVFIAPSASDHESSLSRYARVTSFAKCSQNSVGEMPSTEQARETISGLTAFGKAEIASVM